MFIKIFLLNVWLLIVSVIFVLIESLVVFKKGVNLDLSCNFIFLDFL